MNAFLAQYQAVIPFSDLTFSCQACEGAGPVFVAGDVTPEGAATVEFSGTGMVIHPAADFEGRMTASYTLRDRYGQVSDPAELALWLVPGDARAPVIIADTATTSAGTAVTGNVLDNDVIGTGYPTEVLACGHAANGTVICDPDGSFEYVPRDGFTGIDQFSYHTVTPSSGDQAVGSVVVGVGDDPRHVLAIEPGPEVEAPMTPAQPLTPREAARQSGALALWWDAVVAIGGTP